MPRRGENIRKRKDGRWEGRYIKSRDTQGKAKYASVYGKSYKEVKQKLLFAKIDAKEIKKETALPLSKLLELWMKNNHIKHKGSTETKYQYMTIAIGIFVGSFIWGRKIINIEG